MRDLKKALTDYKKRYSHRNGTEGAFYCSDISQIYEMSKNQKGEIDVFSAIADALEVGYMIGYRTAERHARKKNALASAATQTRALRAIGN